MGKHKGNPASKRIFNFENKNEPLLSRNLFIRRAVNHLLLGILTIFISLIIGILGYRFIEGMSWIDSLLNASMILGGMGPVGEMHRDAGKFFASMYALFSGIIFLVTVGIIIAPAVHRFLHRLHVEDEEEK
ncbi:MAG: hypothetical protein NTX65_13715 [Ignavibacteriales bacterium]|nr:hypothetical protein [Ignavibacteriales bacterium]